MAQAMSSVHPNSTTPSNNTNANGTANATSTRPTDLPANAAPPAQADGPNMNPTSSGTGIPSYATSASLYVGELAPEVTEAMLFELFTRLVGNIMSIRVCRDAVTRRSLGYAYVNFHSMQDAERALDTFNYTNIAGQQCRIMWSQRDPSLRKSGAGNIFIKNLAKDIDNKALHDTFSAFGNILSCKVAADMDGKSKGYAFVHYETQEAAESAIENVNGMMLNDCQVFVGPHISRKERTSQADAMKAKFTNIYIKNLDGEISEAKMVEMFSKFGEITSAAIKSDEQGQSKGFGFINFKDHETAERAVKEMHEAEVNGKVIYVDRAQNRQERDEELRKQRERTQMERGSQNTNLYVKNLDDSIDDETLRAEFAQYGTITSAKVMRDDKGTSRGFGFVCFSLPDEATKAVSDNKSRILGGKPIYVALAQRKADRKALLEQRFAASGGARPQWQPNAGPVIPGYGPAGIYPQGQNPMYYMQPGMPRQMGYPNPMMARPGWTSRTGNMPRAGPPMAGYAGMPQAYIPQQRQGRGGPLVGSRPGMGREEWTAAQQQQLASQQQQMQAGRMAQNMVPPGHAPGQPPSAARRGGGNFAYKQNVRNPAGAMANDVNGNMNPTMMNAAATANNNMGMPLANSLTQLLASAEPTMQKQILGERLYPQIMSLLASRNQDKSITGKITGMLLEMDNSELLHLLEDPGALSNKVTEAQDVLYAHSKQLQQQQQKQQQSQSPQQQASGGDANVKVKHENNA